MKRIVCVLGSPRLQGNSAAIAKRFCEEAEKLGASVETFVLNKLSYRGCQGCMACKTKLDRCVLKDDLTQVLDAVREADVLVMASPVYYGDVSSQLKAFIDRTFSYLVPDFATNPNPSRLKPGKKLVFVLAQAQPDEKLFSDIYPRYESFFKWYGFDGSHLIRCAGVQAPGEAEKRADVMAQAAEVARALLA
jgi:multimeric flavodoxin WrbA